MQNYPSFRKAILHQKVRSHALLTLPPLVRLRGPVRLACLRHAASVHPELGSNSQIKKFDLKIYSKEFMRSLRFAGCHFPEFKLLLCHSRESGNLDPRIREDDKKG